MTHVRSHANSQQKSRHTKDTLYHSTDTKFDSRENPMTASRRDPAGRGRGAPQCWKVLGLHRGGRRVSPGAYICEN